MNNSNYKIKLQFIQGLKEVVITEVKKKTDFEIVKVDTEAIYLNFKENFESLLNLKSVKYIYLTQEGELLNPGYISKHKSLLKNIVLLINNKTDKFKSFRLSCAGSDSDEARSITRFISEEFKLTETEDGELKIHIAKLDNIWELGAQITNKPISYRKYKVENMSGAMDPTIAYSLNTLCELTDKKSYLNAFSGSGTLLIEAGLEYMNLQNLIGFDNNKEHLSMAYRNVKTSGQIEKIKLHEADIFQSPEFGKFDVIVADLPFGMAISKGSDLENIYSKFIEYSTDHLNENGVIGVYTSEHELLKEVLKNNRLIKIKKEVKIKLITNVNSYLYPSILILEIIK